MTDTTNASEQLLNNDVKLHEEVLSEVLVCSAAMAPLERVVQPNCKFKHSSETRKGDMVGFTSALIEPSGQECDVLRDKEK